jgi:hypothetical protein
MEKKIIINIGRQFGSGGKDIAAALGRKLNIPVYDGELIDKAAQDSGFSAELFKRSDEKKSFSFSALFSGTFIGGTEEYMSGNGLFKMQSGKRGAFAKLAAVSETFNRTCEGDLDKRGAIIKGKVIHGECAREGDLLQAFWYVVVCRVFASKQISKGMMPVVVARIGTDEGQGKLPKPRAIFDSALFDRNNGIGDG